jgi:hypothetical protein
MNNEAEEVVGEKRKKRHLLGIELITFGLAALPLTHSQKYARSGLKCNSFTQICIML